MSRIFWKGEWDVKELTEVKCTEPSYSVKQPQKTARSGDVAHSSPITNSAISVFLRKKNSRYRPISFGDDPNLCAVSKPVCGEKAKSGRYGKIVFFLIRITNFSPIAA